MSDAVKTLFNAALLTCSVSSVAIIAFGNGTAIGAMFLVLICSCVVCFVNPMIEMHSCGCTSLSLIAEKINSQECLTCLKPIETAFNAICVFLSIVFVAIFIYAITIRRR